MNTSLFVGLVLVVAAPAPKKAGDEAPDKIEGEWVVESIDGPKDLPKGLLKFRFTEGKLFVSKAGRGNEEPASYTLDTTKKPVTIDIRPESGPKDEVIVGIIEVKGDAMKFCFGKAERPTEFKGNPDKEIMLFNMKRAKPEK